MAAKRAQILDQVRTDRNVAKPPEKAASVSSSVSGSNETQSSSVSAETNEAAAPSETTSGKQSGSQITPSPEGSQLQSEWVKRERDVAQAEAKIRDAQTAAEARIAKAEADEAKAQQKLQELEFAKSEPLEFLAKVGMTKDEWTHFMQQGGKMSPEAKRLKAMETRFNELEQNYQKLSRQAEESQRKALIDQENAAFAPKLGSYTLVSKIGGIQAVRNKQAEILRTQGARVSLEHAAKALDEDMLSNLAPLLKFEDVRAKLGLASQDQLPANESPKARTAEAPKALEKSSKEDPTEHIHPLDWAAKKRHARKLMDLKELQRSAL